MKHVYFFNPLPFVVLKLKKTQIYCNTNAVLDCSCKVDVNENACLCLCCCNCVAVSGVPRSNVNVVS